jgi:NAD(P)H-flavin reductase
MLNVLQRPDLPAAVIVARPRDGGDVLVVVGGGLKLAAVRALSRALLRKPERVQLACALRQGVVPIG